MENNEYYRFDTVARGGGDGGLVRRDGLQGGQERVLWAIGGGLLGLVVTTIVMGLGQATFIPFSTRGDCAVPHEGGGVGDPAGRWAWGGCSRGACTVTCSHF